MEIIHINPFVRYIGLASKPELCTKGVCAYDCRLFYILKGQGNAYVCGKKLEYSEGTVILVREGICYRFEFSKGEESMLIVNFDLDMSNIDVTLPRPPVSSEEFDKSIILHSPNNSFFSNICAINKCFSIKDALLEILDNDLTKATMYAEKNSALLKSALTEIFCRKAVGADKIPDAVRGMKRLARENYASITDAGVLQEKLGYNAQYLNRLFKHYTGMTFHKYLVEVRMNEAKKRLLKTNDTSEEIALQCGFVNASHFCSTFKKHTGYSPGEFRQNSMNILG